MTTRSGGRGVRFGAAALLALAAFVIVAREPIAPPPAVLFIGNSFTFQHDVPGRVARLAAEEDAEIKVVTLAKGGARLSEHLADRQVMRTLAAADWAAVVLQDFSLTAASPSRAAAGAEAAAALAAAAPPQATVVLFVPWPRARRHPYYRRTPEGDLRRFVTPSVLAKVQLRHAEAIAAEIGAVVAPVGPAFVASANGDAALYAEDLYHASPAGADRAAEILWATLRPRLAAR
ncbi:MAG: hypothetical protein ACFBRM_16335 [Pikeienuella sp.]